MKTTAADVARWMFGELERDGWLEQEVAVTEILDRFGEEFTYTNENGNLAIDRVVLKEFRKLTKDSAVWVRSDRAWRRREEDDVPGVRLVD